MLFALGFLTGAVAVCLLGLAVHSFRRALRVWDGESGYTFGVGEENF